MYHNTTNLFTTGLNPNVKSEINSLDIAKIIVDHNPDITSVNIFKHKVGLNWRQKFSEIEHKDNVNKKCFIHNNKNILEDRIIDRKTFLNNITLENLTKSCAEGEVWSLKSLVHTQDEVKHIPMMNFHPEFGGLDFVQKTIEKMHQTSTRFDSEGFILESGRYYHYYGKQLINDMDFTIFISHFLMPSTLISPRYAGHCLFEGFTSLRLTAALPHKPKIPSLIITV